MKLQTNTLVWTVGDCGTAKGVPTSFIPAKVPGSIQQDFAAAFGYEDWNVFDRFHQFDWMEDHYFLYEAELPTVHGGERMILRALGIDYEYEITVNGNAIYHHEGMFCKTELDLTPYLTGNDRLGVLIYPIPRVENPTMERDNVRQSCKPGVSYGWDFHPHLVVRGIWDDITVLVTDSVYLSGYGIHTRLSKDLQTAEGTVEVAVGGTGSYTVRLEVDDPHGNRVLSGDFPAGKTPEFVLENPELWMPNGYGTQPLYRFTVTLLSNGTVQDQKQFFRGFRTLELIPYEGSWGLPVEFPSYAWPQPLTYRINGKEVFAQGTNWVCPTIFYGSLTREDYDIQLRAIRDAGMNYIRCWGGAIVNKEAFFDLCDAYGLLVWQEFPLGCNCYDATDHYMALLDQESTAIIERVKQHTCLAMWSGGNELFMPWSGMTMQSLPIRLMASNCFRFDPDTPFIPTSPISDFVHGDYRFRDENGRDVIQLMNSSDATGYNEIGCGGAADWETICYVIPPEERDEVRTGTAWETHHAVNAWLKDSHLYPDMVRYYFGRELTVKQIVEKSQLLQAIGYQYIYEEARRQQPRCSMVLNWCFNEPWPTAANNSIFSYNNQPKPAYERIREALRPSIPTLRLERFEYFPDEPVNLQVWWLARDPVALDGTVTVTVNCDGDTETVIRQPVCETEVYRSRHLFDCTCLPRVGRDTLATVCVIYEGTGGQQLRSEYRILLRAVTSSQNTTKEKAGE